MPSSSRVQNGLWTPLRWQHLALRSMRSTWTHIGCPFGLDSFVYLVWSSPSWIIQHQEILKILIFTICDYSILILLFVTILYYLQLFLLFLLSQLFIVSQIVQIVRIVRIVKIVKIVGRHQRRVPHHRCCYPTGAAAGHHHGH